MSVFKKNKEVLKSAMRRSHDAVVLYNGTCEECGAYWEITCLIPGKSTRSASTPDVNTKCFICRTPESIPFKKIKDRNEVK